MSHHTTATGRPYVKCDERSESGEGREGLPINRENMAAMVVAIDRAGDRARVALVAAGPRLAAVVESMQRAMRGNGS